MRLSFGFRVTEEKHGKEVCVLPIDGSGEMSIRMRSNGSHLKGPVLESYFIPVSAFWGFDPLWEWHRCFWVAHLLRSVRRVGHEVAH